MDWFCKIGDISNRLDDMGDLFHKDFPTKIRLHIPQRTGADPGRGLWGLKPPLKPPPSNGITYTY